MRVYRPGGEIAVGEYTPNEHDNLMMDVALEQMKEAIDGQDSPVGCAYVGPDGEVTARSTREFRDKNRLAHAEMLGYAAVQPEAGLSLREYTLYSTVEPCHGCAYLLDKAELGALFIATEKSDAPHIFRNPDTLDHIWSRSRRTLTVVSGLRKARALALIDGAEKRH